MMYMYWWDKNEFDRIFSFRGACTRKVYGPRQTTHSIRQAKPIDGRRETQTPLARFVRPPDILVSRLAVSVFLLLNDLFFSFSFHLFLVYGAVR